MGTAVGCGVLVALTWTAGLVESFVGVAIAGDCADVPHPVSAQANHASTLNRLLMLGIVARDLWNSC